MSMLLTLLATVTSTAGDYDAERHAGGHELHASVGFMPLDPYAKSLAITGAYAYHFGALLGWEVLRAGYVVSLPTDLGEELAPTRDEAARRLELVATSALLLKPFSGRLFSVFGETMELELALIAGPAIARYADRDLLLGGTGGGGARIFFPVGISLRFDIRNYWMTGIESNTGFRHELEMTAGVSFNVE